jgi:cytochrome P450
MNSPIDFNELPAPPGWPIAGNLFQLKQDRIHLILEDWARKYGSFYRLRAANRKALIIADHAGIMQVLKERPATFRRSKTIESVMEDMGVTGLVSAEGEHWKRQRRLSMQAFNPAHLRSFFPQVVKVTRRLLNRWRAAASSGSGVDVQPELSRYATDVTAGLAFGSDINTIEGSSDVVRHLNRIFPMIHSRVNTPIPYWRYVKLPADRSFDRALHDLHLAVDEFIAQARARMRADPSLLERPANLIEALVAARDAPDSGFTDDDVFGNVFSTLLAGADGTANTIAWVVYFLCESPEWQRIVQKEADALLGDEDVLHDFDTFSIPFPNTDAVIQEAMRLKPAFPILLHESNVDTSIGNVRVPAGTIIVLLLRMVGLDPAVFPDAGHFTPARWLQPDADRTYLVPFGSGPRMCVGRPLAMQELKMITTMVARNFTAARTTTTAVEERLEFSMRPLNFTVAFEHRR